MARKPNAVLRRVRQISDSVDWMLLTALIVLALGTLGIVRFA